MVLFIGITIIASLSICASFWMLRESIRGNAINRANDIKKFREIIGDITSSNERIVDLMNKQIDFIDKNINERVVYADKETGYNNEDKLQPLNEAEEQDEEIEVQELDASQLEQVMSNKD